MCLYLSLLVQDFFNRVEQTQLLASPFQLSAKQLSCHCEFFLISQGVWESRLIHHSALRRVIRHNPIFGSGEQVHWERIPQQHC